MSGVTLDIFEDMIKRGRYNTSQLERRRRPHHGPGLAAARLAVGEDRPVEAFHHTLDEGVAALLVELLLRTLFIISGVEGEGLLRGFLFLVGHDVIVLADAFDDAHLILVYGYYGLSIFAQFFFV